MQRSDYQGRQRRIPEEGNPSLVNIPEQISEEYFGINEAETSRSDIKLYLCISNVRLFVSWMNSLFLMNIFGPKKEEIIAD
jgi:hypothetical protein